MSMISLIVKYRTGKDATVMEFKRDALIRDVITMIVSKNDMPLHYAYVLFNPQAEPTSPNCWIHPDDATTLASTSINHGETIELLCEPATLNVCRIQEKDNLELGNISLATLNASKKSTLVDFTEPLYKMMPACYKFFPIKKKKNRNYCILKLQVNDSSAAVVGMLNMNLSPYESNLSPNGYVLLLSLDYFYRPASSILNPTFVGHVSFKIKKGDKVGKPKKFLFVQKYNILYYYTSRTSLVPEGMIDLQYMKVSLKNKQLTLSHADTINQTVIAPTNEYIFETDAPNGKDIIRKLWRHSATGAGKHVFGVSLAHLWERKFSPDLPMVVTSCVDHITKYGLNTEGVLQDQGSKEVVEMLRDEFDKGGEVDLDSLNVDAISVGQLLKTYLMELPEPILTYNLYTDFWKARNNTGNLLIILGQLPSQNQLLVKYLITFFFEFVRHAAANRITLHALALNFTPCFLRPKDDYVAQDATLITSVLSTLIANSESFVPMPRTKSSTNKLKWSTDSTSSNSNTFSPPFPVNAAQASQATALNLTPPGTPPGTPPSRLSLRLAMGKSGSLERPDVRREPSNPSFTPPATPSSSSGSSSATHASTPAVPPSPTLPAARPHTPPPTRSATPPPVARTPPPARTQPLSRYTPPPQANFTVPLPMPLPPPTPTPTTTTDAPPAPTPATTETPAPTQTSNRRSLNFTPPPSPNTVRRTAGLTQSPNATPKESALYAAAAAADAAADARAAAMAALAALDFLDAELGLPTQAHGSVALGLPPLPPSVLAAFPPPPPSPSTL